NFFSTRKVMPKTSRVQIIRPRPGVTRKLPPSSSAAAAARGSPATIFERKGSTVGLEEERDKREDEGVEGDSLGQSEAEPADRLELGGEFGLTGNRLDLLAEDEA